ncbi:MAG: ABC transporter substrate-binding protein [Candidatus Tectomicrobia bacterium]|nr:ABC transporter substrate-binding protein [Candidatus Tectomicrobia bacterium]
MKMWTRVVLFCGVVLGLTVGAPLAAEKVSATMSFVFHGGHTPFFAGLGTGQYKEQGLDVTIQRGYGSNATISTIFAGKSQFGEADAGTLVAARSRDVKVKEVGMIYHNSQAVVITLKETGIRTPADFKGKRVGVVQASATRTLFPALLQRNNLKDSDVIYVPMTAAALPASQLTGQIDMHLSFAVTAVPLKMKAKAMNREVVEIPYSDLGLPLYSNGIVASDALIEKSPDLVRRFVKATIEAMVWAVDNPSAGADHFMKYNTSLSREAVLEQWKTTIRFVVTPESLETGLGFMKEDKMAFTRDIVLEYMKKGLGPSKVEARDLYTNQFIPGKLVPKSAR